MSEQFLSTILAVWAAVISTTLACVKLWEVWEDRLKLSTNYEFSAPGFGGNKITIYNPSNRPVMISYWSLIWMKSFWLTLRSTDGRYPDFGYTDITIPAHGRHILVFDGDEFFDWGSSTIPLGILYIRLDIVGHRRPLTLKIYDPRSNL